ncbi:MAG TPA: hypothetical protein VEL28_04915 [Candidatus Binatia bacterium]|nr:hypothetical protein [Candidatus Binatia bacterium]
MTRPTARRSSPSAAAPAGAISIGRILMAATLLIGGCTAQKGPSMSGPPPAMQGSKVALSSVDVRFEVAGDAKEILAEAVTDALSLAKVSCTPGTPSCAALDVRAAIHSPAAAFRSGSAGMPIRIVELSSSIRDGATLGSMRHQRTIAVAGNMSTATWMRVADQLATDLVRELSVRSTGDSAILSLAAWAAHDASLGRVSTPQAFHVPVVSDTRADTARIGMMTSSEGKKFPIRMTRRPTDYLTEAIGDELRAVGHVIVPAMDGRLVGTELETFWIDATQSGSGWNVTARIEVDFEVAPPPGIKRRKAERHACTRTWRGGGAPSEADLTGVLEACVIELMASMRNDAVWQGS